jgi:hypothetical protein
MYLLKAVGIVLRSAAHKNMKVAKIHYSASPWLLVNGAHFYIYASVPCVTWKMVALENWYSMWVE